MIARLTGKFLKPKIATALLVNYLLPRYFIRPIAYFTYIYTTMIANK